MRSIGAGALLVTGTFLLYAATLSRHYSADSIVYAMDIESGAPSALIDPYHLLLHPLGWLAYRLWQAAGWSGGALVPAQLLNALCGAVCVGLVFAIGRGLRVSSRIAALTAIGFAVSGATWLLATEAEFVTVPLAAQLAVLWAALAVGPEVGARIGYAVLLAVGVAIATLFYLNSLLLVPVVVVALLTREEVPRPVRRRQTIAFAGFLLAIAVGVAAALSPVLTSEQWTTLRLLLGGTSYSQVPWQSLPHGAYGFLRSLALFTGLGVNDSTGRFLSAATTGQRAAFVGYYGAVLLVAALPLVLGVMRRVDLWRRHGRAVTVLLVWAVLFTAFALFWVPGDVTFWLPVVAAWWLLTGLVLDTAFRERHADEGKVTPRSPWGTNAGRHAYSFAALCVVILFVANAVMVILPHRDLSRNRAYHIAAGVAANTDEGDLILASAEDTVGLYVMYFARREALFLPDRWWQAAVPDALPPLLEDTWAEGGRVFVAPASGNDPANPPTSSEPREDGDIQVGEYSLVRAWTMDDAVMHELRAPK